MPDNNKANESISKYKLLSAYGGPGSIIHTQYGSVIISCIEEWGFLKKVLEIENEGISMLTHKSEEKVMDYVISHAKLPRNGNIGFSDDTRLLRYLIDRKKLSNLKYLVLFPTIDVKNYTNNVKDGKVFLTVTSSFMPKIFADRSRLHKSYNEWYKEWKRINSNDQFGNDFFPPKKNWNVDNGSLVLRNSVERLTQDNIVLICDQGHISDFPWSQYLRWRNDNPNTNFKNTIDLFNMQPCCGSTDNPTAKIVITSNTANSSGFDGKIIKCINQGCGSSPKSLQGLMSVKIKCPGHKPWETCTGDEKFYSGDPLSRGKMPPKEIGGCNSRNPMKVALTTGNNLYYSKCRSSIFIPDELFEDEITLKLKILEEELEVAKNENNFTRCIEVNDNIKQIKANKKASQSEELLDSEKDIEYKFQEFTVFRNKSIKDINIKDNCLKVNDATNNLKTDIIDFSPYFDKILRIDNMKITSAQLDFSRIDPSDADANPEELLSQNIFRSNPDNVKVYPVVENYGEGIFFVFNTTKIEDFFKDNRIFIDTWKSKLIQISKSSDSFSKRDVEYGKTHNWQLYLVHTFSHLIMRELEFRCGYPTSSISERIYVSNEEKYKMYGCLIYTAEGAEGSMGGIIAQTRIENLANLIKSALKRSTICHSDPLCWESEGQGLFDLNFASCFACSLVSETSCELRNIYLDRRILVDEGNGFFRDIINQMNQE